MGAPPHPILTDCCHDTAELRRRTTEGFAVRRWLQGAP